MDNEDKQQKDFGTEELIKCKKCGIEKENNKLRRGWCLNCYREETGFSRGQITSKKPEKILKKILEIKSLIEKKKKIMEKDRLHLNKLKNKYHELRNKLSEQLE